MRLKHRNILSLTKRKLRRTVLRREDRAPAGSVFGVNFASYVRSEMGVGETVRCAVRAANAAGLPVSVKSVDRVEGPYRLLDLSLAGDREFPYAFNIFHVNADQSPIALAELGDNSTRRKYNIGYWAWQLEEFPARWQSSVSSFREIWAPSSFCAEAIARAPPLRVPHAIQLDPAPALDRAAFAIPPDAFVFLCVFDLMSGFERKNPLGVIAAFRAAFQLASQGDERCRLVLKINHAERRTNRLAEIRNAAAR